MDNKAWEGVIWAIITGLCGFGVATSAHPLPKLLFSLAAIGAATEAGNCFYSTANATHQQLAVPREYRQLPPRAHYD